MRNNKKMIVSVFWIVLGAAFTVMNLTQELDSYWSGLGTAFIVVGALQIMRYVKYAKNEQYREAVDTRNNDERNKFIGTKAWAWAGYFYVLGGAVAVIVLNLMGMKEASQIISFSVCSLLCLYWIFYLILRKKY